MSVLVGEAFSEFAPAAGELVSCNAHTELRAMVLKNRRSARHRPQDSETAVDLAENMAAREPPSKKPQTNSGSNLIPEMLKKWNAK